MMMKKKFIKKVRQSDNIYLAMKLPNKVTWNEINICFIYHSHKLSPDIMIQVHVPYVLKRKKILMKDLFIIIKNIMLSSSQK